MKYTALSISLALFPALLTAQTRETESPSVAAVAKRFDAEQAAYARALASGLAKLKSAPNPMVDYGTRMELSFEWRNHLRSLSAINRDAADVFEGEASRLSSAAADPDMAEAARLIRSETEATLFAIADEPESGAMLAPYIAGLDAAAGELNKLEKSRAASLGQRQEKAARLHSLALDLRRLSTQEQRAAVQANILAKVFFAGGREAYNLAQAQALERQAAAFRNRMPSVNTELASPSWMPAAAVPNAEELRRRIAALPPRALPMAPPAVSRPLPPPVQPLSAPNGQWRHFGDHR